MHDEAQMAARALKVGAAGYATKDSDPALLLTAIRRVARAGVTSIRTWPTAWSSKSA
jgi:DNA-binding NarL/FixJ family response regulator